MLPKTDEDKRIDDFLSQPAFAVAGASTNREKYGNKVVRVYQQNGKTVYPLNPKSETIEGEHAYPDIDSLPTTDLALSIVTPPSVTLQIVRAALARGIKYFWMQPGAENAEAVEEANRQGAVVIHDGPCVLVALGYHE